MRLPLPFLWIVALLALARPAEAQEDHERAFDVAREVERLAAATDLWPGFEPLAVPLALYDGERTLLFRHPAPPEGFVLVPNAAPPAYAYAGRHPNVTANSSAELGGAPTATLMLNQLGGTTEELAGIALHEAFHVFQRARHPGWQANEVDLFVYPLDDAALLTLRRLETEALRRAIAVRDASACWARRALALRRERFARMDSAFVAYDRGSELTEGLANYVEARAIGRLDVPIPPGGFAAAAVRDRAYTTGAALAFLLDRHAPGWQAGFERDDTQTLDGALTSALDDVGERGCTFTGVEEAEAARRADADVAALLAERSTRRATFDRQPGVRLVVEAAEGQPLWPQGFDPLNVHRVEGGVLHARFLRLGNEAGHVEMIGEAEAEVAALTEGAGPHPLFNGVRRLVVAGLSEPEVATDGAAVTLRAPGLTLQFSGAEVVRSGREVRIRLPSR